MPHTPTRLLSLDPTHKGFGYAILELPFRLVDWGFSQVSGEKHAGAVSSFERLLDRFRPDAVVLEDPLAPGSRRRPRIRRLIQDFMRLARERGIAVFAVARLAVLKCFSTADKVATKYSIAKRLAEYFPELGTKLPAPRKPWQSEDQRLAIFDALALAVTHATK